MATWREMSLECLRGAKRLLDEGYLRRSTSCSYYAAYCAATSDLSDRGLTFAHGWGNTSHEQLPDLILNNSTLPRNTRYQVNRILRRLRVAREAADYRPAATVDRPLALACVRDATSVLFRLGIEDE